MQKTSYSWRLGFLMLWSSLLLARVALCEPTTRASDVDKAIVYILSRGIPKHLIYPAPRHVLLRNPEQRFRLAKAIVVAAKKNSKISPWILVAVAFREGSFKHNRKGPGGEESVFQIMPSTMRRVREFEPECSFTTVEGSALCAAALLTREYNNCGSMAGAITKYVTGKSCKPKTAHVKWIVWDRQGIARMLKKMFLGGTDG